MYCSNLRLSIPSGGSESVLEKSYTEAMHARVDDLMGPPHQPTMITPRMAPCPDFSPPDSSSSLSVEEIVTCLDDSKDDTSPTSASSKSSVFDSMKRRLSSIPGKSSKPTDGSTPETYVQRIEQPLLDTGENPCAVQTGQKRLYTRRVSSGMSLSQSIKKRINSVTGMLKRRDSGQIDEYRNVIFSKDASDLEYDADTNSAEETVADIRETEASRARQVQDGHLVENLWKFGHLATKKWHSKAPGLNRRMSEMDLVTSTRPEESAIRSTLPQQNAVEKVSGFGLGQPILRRDEPPRYEALQTGEVRQAHGEEEERPMCTRLKSAPVPIAIKPSHKAITPQGAMKPPRDLHQAQDRMLGMARHLETLENAVLNAMHSGKFDRENISSRFNRQPRLYPVDPDQYGKGTVDLSAEEAAHIQELLKVGDVRRTMLGCYEPVAGDISQTSRPF